MRTTVAIIGGGPVGTALAIDLALRGIDCTLIERHHAPQPVPKGQNLTQRTVEHFRAWGIERELHEARTMGDGKVGGMTAYGTLLEDRAYPWLQRGLVGDFYHAPNERLPQYATERVLRARLAQLPVVARYGWTAETVEQDEDGVRVGIVSEHGERDVVEADWVVGCDGSRSRVREAAGITQTFADHDRLMALVVFRSPEFDEIMTQWPDVSFVNVLHPDLEGYWQFFGRVDATETWFFHAPVDPASTAETIDVHAVISRAVGRDFAFDVEYLGFWDLRFALADAYRAGRILIAGDAAHSHPPYGGYGVNSGLEDAANLGWKLAAQIAGWAGDDLLDSYDAERRPVFASTRDDFIDRSIRDDRDFLATHDPDVDLASFDAEWAARANGAAAEVDLFEPNYEGSPIVPGTDGVPTAVGGHEFRARAGHHLAPGTTADGGDVFDALGLGFTLLTGDPATTAEFEEAAARLGVPLTTVVLGADAVTRYETTAVLVRPDQFVTWAGDPADADPEAVLATATGRERARI